MGGARRLGRSERLQLDRGRYDRPRFGLRYCFRLCYAGRNDQLMLFRSDLYMLAGLKAAILQPLADQPYLREADKIAFVYHQPAAAAVQLIIPFEGAYPGPGGCGSIRCHSPLILYRQSKAIAWL